MTKIHKNLFVGNKADYEHKARNQEGWNVIHACKEPYIPIKLRNLGKILGKLPHLSVPFYHVEYILHMFQVLRHRLGHIVIFIGVCAVHKM